MEFIITILGVLLVMLVFCLVLSFPVMWLWNWLMPDIFGLTEITLNQAFGLLVLSNILFKSHSKSSNQ